MHAHTHYLNYEYLCLFHYIYIYIPISIYLYPYIYISISVSLSVIYLFLYLSIYLSIYLSTYLFYGSYKPPELQTLSCQVGWWCEKLQSFRAKNLSLASSCSRELGSDEPTQTIEKCGKNHRKLCF